MKISVAIPTYEFGGKGVDFLDDMFRTLSIQTLKDFEVVISDDSVDDKIENYCNLNEYDLNIKYLRHTGKKGSAAINTNFLLDHCDGEIIKLFFQDDFFYDTEALEKTYKAMNGSSEKWFVCGAIHTNDDGESFFNPMFPRWDDKMILENNHNFIGGTSVLSIKNEVKTRFDSNLLMLLDVDFYYSCMLEYGMPIFYHDILIGNRARNPYAKKEGLTSEDIQKEFEYCHDKYGISL